MCRHTQQEEETAMTGGVTSSAKVPKEDQDGVDMMPPGDTPAEGRYLGSAAGLNAPDRAGEAQVAQEGACAAKAFYSCPAIISRRLESQNTSKEPQLNPEEESRIIQARSHVSSEKSSKKLQAV